MYNSCVKFKVFSSYFLPGLGNTNKKRVVLKSSPQSVLDAKNIAKELHKKGIICFKDIELELKKRNLISTRENDICAKVVDQIQILIVKGGTK